MNIEIGANLTSVVLAFLALLGTVVTGVLSYLNSKKLQQVEKNTNGMTDRLVAAAMREGVAKGIADERARQLGLGHTLD